ncbi:hypothetical protein ACTXT7_012150 [Hymenolepis weldensis]
MAYLSPGIRSLGSPASFLTFKKKSAPGPAATINKLVNELQTSQAHSGTGDKSENLGIEILKYEGKYRTI